MRAYLLRVGVHALNHHRHRSVCGAASRVRPWNLCPPPSPTSSYATSPPVFGFLCLRFGIWYLSNSLFIYLLRERIFLFLHFCSRLREQASPLNPKYSPFYSGVFVASAAASAGAERAGFSARCPRRVHATAPPQALLRARDVWDACAALKRRDLAIGARAGAQRIGTPRRGCRRGCLLYTSPSPRD